MKSLNTVGLALSVVFGCLLLALVAEIYYLLWWKRRFRNREIEDGYNSSPATREFFYMFCWKKPSSLSSTALNPQELTEASTTHVQESLSNGQSGKDFWFRPFGEDSVEAELLGLQNLSGPPRFLFTIKEETKEDLESEEGGGKSRKSSRTRSLSDLVLNPETPFLTPLTSPSYFTPPRTPMDTLYNHNGFNPLYESTSDAEFNKIKSSPPPTFKFLRDAEDKLQKKKLLEEAENCSHKKERFVTEDEDSSYITLIVPRHNKERDTFYPSSSSQVLPLSASPPSYKHSSNKKPSLHHN